MKKLFVGVFALVLTLGVVSCKNEPAAPAEPAAGKVVEQVFSLENLQKMVDKVKAEGANWSVDEWKAAVKEMLTLIAPKLIEMGDLMKLMEDPAKMEDAMTKIKAFQEEYKPVEALTKAFEEAANATENGKAVMDDLEYSKQVKKELGIPVEEDEPEAE